MAIRRRPRRRAREESGAVAVEFALTATLLLTLLLGIVSYGLQFGARILVVQAASEGARAAAVGLTAEERESLAREAADALLERYGGIARTRTVTVAASGAPVTRVDVTVSVDLSAFGLDRLAAFVTPLPNVPSATVSVQVGGF
jgi:Flp pilus assembly protein TadG